MASLTPINLHFVKLISNITLTARQSRVYGPHFTFREFDVCKEGGEGAFLPRTDTEWQSDRAGTSSTARPRAPRAALTLTLKTKLSPLAEVSVRFG